MLSKILSSAIYGIDAYIVEVEVDLASGLFAFSTVGLPDTAVKESRDRVMSAIKNTGFDFPQKRVTVNLAPADVKKEGSSFDLPIAVGILSAGGFIKPDKIKEFIIICNPANRSCRFSTRRWCCLSPRSPRSNINAIIL